MQLEPNDLTMKDVYDKGYLQNRFSHIEIVVQHSNQAIKLRMQNMINIKGKTTLLREVDAANYKGIKAKS